MNNKVSDPIRVYVACLASYNNGILHGAWIDAVQDADDIRDEINAMLKASPIQDSEEYAIHDYEGFCGAILHEYTGIPEVAELAAFIEQHGALGAELINYMGDRTGAMRALENQYIGVYETVADFAEELTQDTTQIPDTLRFYIDYEKMARDMEINDLIVIETAYRENHLFWTH